MKRIATWLLSTVSIVVLLFGYHTSTSGALSATSPAGVLAPPGSGSGAASGSNSSGSGSSGGSNSSGSGSGTSGGSGSGSGNSGANSAPATVAGGVAQTQWGPVQVQLTVANDKITDVAMLQYPNGNSTDLQINSYALPILMRATVQAQSANIDMISGATVTSVGYLQSLQSALDQAGL
jgi:uncharacterized protein with FMN-binding domain